MTNYWEESNLNFYEEQLVKKKIEGIIFFSSEKEEKTPKKN
jgi:hypothetical protein